MLLHNHIHFHRQCLCMQQYQHTLLWSALWIIHQHGLQTPIKIRLLSLRMSLSVWSTYQYYHWALSQRSRQPAFCYHYGHLQRVGWDAQSANQNRQSTTMCCSSLQVQQRHGTIPRPYWHLCIVKCWQPWRSSMDHDDISRHRRGVHSIWRS